MSENTIVAPKEKRRNRDIYVYISIFVICAAVLIAACFALIDPVRRFCVMRMGYFNASEVMALDGYTRQEGTNTYTKENLGVEITVTFDTAALVCYKNDYWFSLEGACRHTNGDLYVTGEVLEQILLRQVILENHVKVRLGEKNVSPWLEMPRLVAHAGGMMRKPQHYSTYTNALEALVQNYSLGHRVFEFDFMPTSDDDLALVHDWDLFGNRDGTPLTAQEWRDIGANGTHEAESPYTALLIGDLLDQMLVNEDIYVVTDSKLVAEEALAEFKILYREAEKRDLALLDRFIPQIYNNEMYDIIMGVYKFPSVIYTTYATRLSSEEIISFSSQRDNIHVITANYEDGRFTDSAVVQSIHDNGMLFYIHTVNTYEDIIRGKRRGVDGFYTDTILPEWLEVYEQVLLHQ